MEFLDFFECFMGFKVSKKIKQKFSKKVCEFKKWLYICTRFEKQGKREFIKRVVKYRFGGLEIVKRFDSFSDNKYGLGSEFNNG